MSMSETGIVHARLLTKDDPVADERLAAEAAEAFSQGGISVHVEMPNFRAGMGGAGPPIDAWIYVVLPVAGAAAGGLMGGFLGAMGADFWKALKSSIGLLRKRRRPANRSIVRLMLRTQAGDEVWISLFPDDPLEALDGLERHDFITPSADAHLVMLSWDQIQHSWSVTISRHEPRNGSP